MTKYKNDGAVVVAQLVERSLPIPEVRGSNPVIGKIYWTFVYCQLCIEKTKNKEKRGRKWPIFKKNDFLQADVKLYIYNNTLNWPLVLNSYRYLCVFHIWALGTAICLI